MNELTIQIGTFTLNLSGIILGLSTILSIWLGRWACIKGEYLFTKKIWILFLIIGIIMAGLALFTSSIIFSAIFSIIAFVFWWGIPEVIEQEQRVNKGWFTSNPKRKKK
ncbi:DUF4491 family protein [Marinilabiliaceae bacterium JC017]|nr:DUF4491 family protein [Marinilabiliaceae bacterium JC017]